MELRHLRYFLAVAEEAHFGRAARRLKIAQPPLSRQVQALERELGFELFDRSMRRVQLTPAGAVLKERATKVLAEVEAAVEAAKRAHVGDTGRLAVGYLSSLAYTGITTVLRAYRERFPEVQLALRELGPQDQVAALKSRAICTASSSVLPPGAQSCAEMRTLIGRAAGQAARIAANTSSG